MSPKYSIGQLIVVVKSIFFYLDNCVVRSGEIGIILDIDSISIDCGGTIVHDYIVLIQGKQLFFYEEEMAPYPNEETK